MITYKQVDESHLNLYDKIPMMVQIKSILKTDKINNGLGGILLKEMPVKEYDKDLGKYELELPPTIDHQKNSIEGFSNFKPRQ